MYVKFVRFASFTAGKPDAERTMKYNISGYRATKINVLMTVKAAEKHI